jgi:hypothetical protein
MSPYLAGRACRRIGPPAFRAIAHPWAHARRSAPASLPQVGPHRRGSPARHHACDCDSPTLVMQPCRSVFVIPACRVLRSTARRERSAPRPWATKAGALDKASLSADRATCFPRDRASCPHARRSAPASLPQDSPHRRGSPARHRAPSQRCLVTPIGSGSDSRNRLLGCFALRPAEHDPRRARGPRRQARSWMWRACRRIGPPASRAIGRPALTRGARLLPRCRRTALTAAARPPDTTLRRSGAS